MKQQEQISEDIVIELKHKMVVLKIMPFDTDIDVDDILRIDHSNILGEILTWNVLFNRIANLRAEMENIVSHSKFDLEVFEAQLFNEKRKQLLNDGEKATEAAIDAAIKSDVRYTTKKKLHFDKVKNFNHLDSLYWSGQNKAGLLRSLSDKLKPEEFEGEILSSSINGVMIKASKKAI